MTEPPETGQDVPPFPILIIILIIILIFPSLLSANLSFPLPPNPDNLSRDRPARAPAWPAGRAPREGGWASVPLFKQTGGVGLDLVRFGPIRFDLP